MDPLFSALPEDIASIEVDALESFISEAQELVEAISADPSAYVTEERPLAVLLSETEAAVEAIVTARAELATRVEAAAGEETDEEVDTDAFAALAARARENEEDEETEEVDESDEPIVAAAEEPADEPVEEPVAEAPAEQPADEPVEEPAAVVAAAKPVRARRLARPARARAAAPPPAEQRVALTASAEGLGYPLGGELPSAEAMAEMMIQRRGFFGTIPEGTHGDKVPIAKFDYSGLYPEDRVLGNDEVENWEKIEKAMDEGLMKATLGQRRKDSLVASGGLCAPVTPYYQLQMISVPDRPVRAALPAFNADRGGITFARPAGLSAITTGVGAKTAAQDEAGGSQAVKTCQVVACPPFEEVDVDILYHCLQFGNLGARTFPERVAQWNSLVLAAHARLAESRLLTNIGIASTSVTAADIGLGATASYLSEVLTAAQAIRSRNRMSTDSVLRLMAPYWAPSLMVSDVIRSQFQRFDTDEQRITALLRSFNIEPTWYMDGASGKAQIFGTQSDGALLPFPDTIVSYLYPEGSFLYVDGGVLELGLVRDSTLNSTNDFQIFGESFENVAFIGVEAYELVSHVCDSGVVSAPANFTECGDYGTS